MPRPAPPALAAGPRSQVYGYTQCGEGAPPLPGQSAGSAFGVVMEYCSRGSMWGMLGKLVER